MVKPKLGTVMPMLPSASRESDDVIVNGVSSLSVQPGGEVMLNAPPVTLPSVAGPGAA